MAASIEEIVSGSYLVWRRNLIMGVPFLLNALINLFLLVASIVFVYFYANPMPKTPYADYRMMLAAMNWGLVLFDMALFIALFFMIWFIQSYFTAGAIGMAKKALETGKTSIDDMIHSGNKHTVKVFLASLITGFVMLVGVLCMLVLQFILNGQYVNIFTIILGILFAPIPYAIVYGSTGVREGLKRGINLALDNKLDITVLFFAASMIEGLITFGGFMAAAAIFSLSLFTIPPGDGSFEMLARAASANMLLILSALGIAILVFMLIMLFIAGPLITTVWANYYQNRMKK